MIYRFEIAQLVLRIDIPHELSVTKGFLPFISDRKSDYDCQFHFVDQLPEINAECFICKDGITDIYQIGSKAVRVYRNSDTVDDLYAIRVAEHDKNEIHLYVRNNFLKYVSESRNVFFHLGIEDILIQEYRMILHSSLIESPYGGILFTGPSGIGKSTQADLWVRYRDSRIINGDRSILVEKDGNWYGYGSPYAGSSQYYINVGIPITAIVVLQQGEEDSIEIIGGKKAFRSLYEGITVNVWNPQFVDRVCDMLGQLIQMIPVYRLKCTPTANAVFILEVVLKGGRDKK